MLCPRCKLYLTTSHPNSGVVHCRHCGRGIPWHAHVQELHLIKTSPTNTVQHDMELLRNAFRLPGRKRTLHF